MKTFLSFACMIVVFFLAGCQNIEHNTETSSEKSKIVEQELDFRAAIEKIGQVFLLGESHADKECLQKEFEIWYTLYHKYGFRYLFIEAGYAAAQWRNLWMKSDNDEILEQLEKDLNQAHVCSKGSDVLDFYKKIKKLCPETTFYGTDIEHQHKTTGKQYLEYLEGRGLKNSKEYERAVESIEQAKQCYACSAASEAYYNDKLVENFRREFDALKDTNVMGIYGRYRIADGDQTDFSVMGKRLWAIYNGNVYTKDLTKNEADFPPINGKSKQIFLLGEKLADKDCLNKEFELWYKYYHRHGFRHLFTESGYATAQLLNLWMKSDNDKILIQLGKDWKSLGVNKIADMLEFYRKIKKLCPKTIFHGTDIENPVTGKRYLKYLENRGLDNSEEYRRAKESIAQYEKYRAIDDGYWILREEMMFRNLERALYLFEGNSVMGIYGSFHVKSGNSRTVSNMADRLSELYGATVHRKDLTEERNDPNDFVNIAHRFVEEKLNHQ